MDLDSANGRRGDSSKRKEHLFRIPLIFLREGWWNVKSWGLDGMARCLSFAYEGVSLLVKPFSGSKERPEYIAVREGSGLLSKMK